MPIHDFRTFLCFKTFKSSKQHLSIILVLFVGIVNNLVGQAGCVNGTKKHDSYMGRRHLNKFQKKNLTECKSEETYFGEWHSCQEMFTLYK